MSILNNVNAVNGSSKRTLSLTLDWSHIDPAMIGVLTLKYPSQMDTLNSGVIKSQLLQGMPEDSVDYATKILATIISTLDVAVISKPEWFDVFSADVEFELLDKVFTEYITWVKSFRKPVGNREDSTDNGGKVSVVGTKDISGVTNRPEIPGVN